MKALTIEILTKHYLGMKGRIMLPEKLDKKYARIWNESCSWKIPKGFRPFSRSEPLTPKEKEMFTTGIWMTVDMMARDGLISQEMLRYWHNKENGWDNRSKINDGYTGKEKFIAP